MRTDLSSANDGEDTIAVYGDSTGQVLTEETPPHPETIYAKTKMAAEKIVLAAKRPDGEL